MIDGGRRRGTIVALWLLLAGVGVASAVRAWERGGAPDAYGLVDVALLAGAATIAGVLVVARGLLVARERAAWMLAALSIFLLLAKDLAWYVAMPGEDTWLAPPVHDAVHLALLVPGLLAMIALLRSRFELTSGPVVDTIAGALILPVVFIALMLGGVVGADGASEMEAISWAVDPALKLIMVSALLAVLARSGSRPDRTFTLLLIGVTLQCVADVLRPGHGVWHAAHPFALMLAIAGVALIAVAAWQPPPAARRKPVLGRGALATPVAFALLALAYLVAGGSLVSSPVLTAAIGAGLLVAAFHAGLVASELHRRHAQPAPGDRPQAVAAADAEPPGAPTATAATAALSDLTPREREVARLIADGLLQKQVALELGVSQKTIEKHLASSRRKLGVATTNELIVLVHSPAGPRSVRLRGGGRPGRPVIGTAPS